LTQVTTPQDADQTLAITNYFVRRIKRKEYRYIQPIINLFSRIRNFLNGTGYKTNLELATEIKQNLLKKTTLPLTPKGFVAEDFDISLAKFQDQPTTNSLKTDPDFAIIKRNFQALCDQVAKKGPIDFTKPPEDATIPPFIHFIWIGSAVPPKIQTIIDTWKVFHPGWIIKTWQDDQINTFPWQPKQRAAFDEALKAKCWAEAADIWRYNILYEEGGIYSDTDVVCVKPFHELISNGVTFFAGQETNENRGRDGYKEPFYICNALIGAAKHSPVMKRCLDALIPRSASKYPNRPKEDLLSRTGPVLLTKACQKELHGSQSNGVLALPCSYIYPLPMFLDGKHKRMSPQEILENYVAPESQCVHLWDGSWV
jgi:mannosyltransferase OCH1-like enzyme